MNEQQRKAFWGKAYRPPQDPIVAMANGMIAEMLNTPQGRNLDIDDIEEEIMDKEVNMTTYDESDPRFMEQNGL